LRVSEGVDEFSLDPWAWLHEIDDEEMPDLSGFRVVAGMLPADGDSNRCARAIESQGAAVEAIFTELSADQPGDWIWVVPDDTEPEPNALSALLNRVLAKRDTSVLGCLLIEPRRRGAGKLVSDWAQTISTNGRARTLTEFGELYQGQLSAVDALGVPAAGMLVRGDVWRFLGGFNADLPRSHWGLDLGWRANLMGYRVVAEPEAQLTNYSGFGDPAIDRAAGLALTVANTPRPWRWLVSVRLALVTVAVSFGYLLGKDLTRSGEEIRGVWRWIRNGELRRALNRQLESLPVNPENRARTKALRPALGSGIRRSAALTAARLGGWLETFSGRGDAASLDEMIGDDFADVGDKHAKVPLVASVASVLALGALVASRNSYETGLLSASQLMPSPESWTTLVDSYLSPVAGSAAAGAPWAALLGLSSLITLGHPDWLVTAVVMLAVPLSWLLTFRLLRMLVAGRYLAAAGALAYALTPALIGGLNSGSLGLAATTVLLPVLGYSARTWLREDRWSWRAAGSVAFWLLLVCALVPLFWVLALVAGLVFGLRAKAVKVWAQIAVVLTMPLLALVGGWGASILRYPGRLLTGAEPILAPTEVTAPWLLFFGHPLESGAPVWLAICFFGALWIAALAGAWRRPGRALAALAVGAGAMVIAITLTRLAVQVPPGVWTRPQALEWLVLVSAALLFSALAGLDGVVVDLSGKALGIRHLGVLALTLVASISLLVATGWWISAGQTGLHRGPAGAVPAFVYEAQVSATPGRTLALVASEGKVSWALVEADFFRLGDSERGFAFGGDLEARALAASVVTRLVGDSADDQILPDLVRLGVSYVTLAGGEASQRISINNTPGLGSGTGTDEQFVWPVPASAVAVVVDGQTRTTTGNGAQIAAGAPGRVLRLALPNDPGWVVEVGGQRLNQRPADAPGIGYDLGSASGTLRYHLQSGGPWWAWIQLAALLVLAVLAAPSVRRRTPAEPRRIAGGEQ
jgi:hypothetical protein